MGLCQGPLAAYDPPKKYNPDTVVVTASSLTEIKIQHYYFAIPVLVLACPREYGQNATFVQPHVVNQRFSVEAIAFPNYLKLVVILRLESFQDGQRRICVTWKYGVKIALHVCTNTSSSSSFCRLETEYRSPLP